MLFDFILVALAVIGIVVMATILIRKFPSLGAIDTNTIPKEREARIKNGLIEQRLQRKFNWLGALTVGRLKEYIQSGRLFFRKIYWKLRDFEHDYQSRTKPISGQADQPEVRSKVSQLIDEAERLLAEAKYTDAEKRCVEAVALDPKNTEAYHCLGELYLTTEDYEHAREVIEHSLTLWRQKLILKNDSQMTPAQKSELGELHTDLGIALRGLGLFNDAITECESALRLVPNNPKYLHTLLDIAITAKKKLLAMRMLDRLKSANPENNKLKELEALVNNL